MSVFVCLREREHGSSGEQFIAGEWTVFLQQADHVMISLIAKIVIFLFTAVTGMKTSCLQMDRLLLAVIFFISKVYHID